MKRIALALLLCGCARHPVATVAIGAGTVGLFTCEANGASFWHSHDTAHTQATCGIIAGGAALFLGGLAALVTHFADTGAGPLPRNEQMLPNGVLRVRSHSEPPPAAPPPAPSDSTSPPQENTPHPADAGVRLP